MPRRTPGIDKFVQERETLTECPQCAGIAVAGSPCGLCLDTGMVTIARADEWRAAKGLPSIRGPLPPLPLPTKT